MRLAVVALAGSLGCYAPAFQDCELACGTGDRCPGGQTCVAGMCRDEGLSGACSVGEIDAPMIDGPSPQWSTPEEAPGIPLGFSDPTLIGNGREMYLAKNNQIFVTQLAVGPPPSWSNPTALPEFTAVGPTVAPYVSFDGLAMYVTRAVAGNGGDIFLAKRSTPNQPFGGLTEASGLNSTNNDSGGATNGDGLFLVLGSNREVVSNVDLYSSSFQTTVAVWRPPVAMAALNHPTADEAHPVLDASGLRIAFVSNRSGNNDIYLATRPDVTSGFDAPTPIGDINTSASETDPWLSPDGKTLYFVRGVGPASRIMRSMRL